MESRLYRFGVLVLYQLTLILGIMLLPFALVARRFGVRLPVHRAVTTLGTKYDQARSN